MTVEERLEALEKEVQRLKDVQAIKELKSKYFRALDTKNWDELETTMTPNISTAYSNGKLVFHGPKEITNYFKESMPHTEITLHQGHNPVIWWSWQTPAPTMSGMPSGGMTICPLFRKAGCLRSRRTKHSSSRCCPLS